MGSPAARGAGTFALVGLSFQGRGRPRGAAGAGFELTIPWATATVSAGGKGASALAHFIPQTLRERRAAHRLQVNLPARYASSALSVVGWVANLSRNGMFLRSGYLDEAGAEVSISFALPDEAQPVALRGRVVRVNDGGGLPGDGHPFHPGPRRSEAEAGDVHAEAPRRLDESVRRRRFASGPTLDIMRP
jgi:hypothetical protein